MRNKQEIADHFYEKSVYITKAALAIALHAKENEEAKRVLLETPIENFEEQFTNLIEFIRLYGFEDSHALLKERAETSLKSQMMLGQYESSKKVYKELISPYNPTRKLDYTNFSAILAKCNSRMYNVAYTTGDILPETGDYT